MLNHFYIIKMHIKFYQLNFIKNLKHKIYMGYYFTI